ASRNKIVSARRANPGVVHARLSVLRGECDLRASGLDRDCKKLVAAARANARVSHGSAGAVGNDADGLRLLLGVDRNRRAKAEAFGGSCNSRRRSAGNAGCGIELFLYFSGDGGDGGTSASGDLHGGRCRGGVAAAGGTMG